MDMIQFAKETRTTSYFLNEELGKVKVAYRIMEYLAPDDCFPPKINKETFNKMLKGDYIEAVYEIRCELGLDDYHDYGDIDKSAIELIEYLLPIYLDKLASDKEKRKIELFKELAELDKE